VPEDAAGNAGGPAEWVEDTSTSAESTPYSAADSQGSLGSWDAVSEDGDVWSSIDAAAALSSAEPEEEFNPYTPADAERCAMVALV